MKAIYIGEDGCMGLVKYKQYSAKVEIASYKGKMHIWVIVRVDAATRFICPYESLDKLLENWKVIEQVKKWL